MPARQTISGHDPLQRAHIVKDLRSRLHRRVSCCRVVLIIRLANLLTVTRSPVNLSRENLAKARQCKHPMFTAMWGVRIGRDERVHFPTAASRDDVGSSAEAGLEGLLLVQF